MIVMPRKRKISANKNGKNMPKKSKPISSDSSSDDDHVEENELWPTNISPYHLFTLPNGKSNNALDFYLYYFEKLAIPVKISCNHLLSDENRIKNDKLKILTISNNLSNNAVELDSVGTKYIQKLCSNQNKAENEKQFLMILTDDNEAKLLDRESKLVIYLDKYFDQGNQFICHLWPSQSIENYFSLEGHFDVTEQSPKFFLDVYVSKNIIFDDYDLFKQCSLTRNATILEFMRFLFNYSFHESTKTDFGPNQFNAFYESVMVKQADYLSKYECESPLKIDDSKLNTTLWEHQRNAIKWMLNREHGNYQNDVSQMFVKHTFENVIVYYNTTFGHFLTEEVYQKFVQESNNITKGGILADEMGLGKTVDVIALILNNKKPDTSLNSPVFTPESLFSLSTNPLQGELQCCCGKESITLTETITIDELKSSCLEKNHHLNENLIKCLMCANYQHVECSSYNFDCLYLCCRCWTKVEPVRSPATLIVCPNSILQQWEEEMERHINPDLGIKIFNYRGVKSKQYSSPLNLASYDIVITTYEILRTELDYLNTYNHDRLRNSKRYFSQISPLSSVIWWRLCFDEAQLVESNMTKVFKMAQSLPSEQHWAITGTPLQKSLDDLYGLLRFIQEKPYSESFIWKYALYLPFRNDEKENLINVLSKCFWRRSKERVMEELKIPKPIEKINTLHFSQIERDYYLTKAVSYLGFIYNILCNTSGIHGDLKINRMTNNNQTLMCQKALRLRQICCHPRMSSNKYNIKQFNSLQDVLDYMIEESRNECEKHHRNVIASLNGMAAIYILLGEFKQAVQTYRNALHSISEYEYIRTDKTQKFHIYYNLAQILEAIGCQQLDSENNPFPPFNGTQKLPKFSPITLSDLDKTNEDDKYLRLKAKEIYDAYLNAAKLTCVTSDNYRLNLIKQCSGLKKKLRTEYWCIYVLKTLPASMESNDIIATIHNILSCSHASYLMPKTLGEITNSLTKYLDSFEKLRAELLSAFEPLTIEDLKNSINECIECHVRSSIEPPPTCCLCKAETKIKQFEEIIFNVAHGKNNSDPDNKSTDASNSNNNWNEQNNLLALRKLANSFKTKAAKNEENISIINEIDNYFEYIEACKKEYKAHRKYHVDCCEFILRIDELNQAQTRFNETMSVEALENEMYVNTTNDQQLNVSLDRFKYLSNLKESLKNKDNVESRLCSVCWCNLTRYVILKCGHLICEECCINIKRHTQVSERKCPVCRTHFIFENISLIDVRQAAVQGNLEVKGNCSTKMVSIIRCVRKILESGEKILIFSTWPQMLSMMNEVLGQNDIKSVVINSSDKNFYNKISDFKSGKSDCSVLLLPTQFACNGLNLVEASHVIFINSTPNKTDELQAIGRVYRIGQTRQTFVHKFVITDTIEEMLEQNKRELGIQKGNRDLTDLTIEEFCNLFNIYDHLRLQRG